MNHKKEEYNGQNNTIKNSVCVRNYKYKLLKYLESNKLKGSKWPMDTNISLIRKITSIHVQQKNIKRKFNKKFS